MRLESDRNIEIWKHSQEKKLRRSFFLLVAPFLSISCSHPGATRVGPLWDRGKKKHRKNAATRKQQKSKRLYASLLHSVNFVGPPKNWTRRGSNSRPRSIVYLSSCQRQKRPDISIALLPTVLRVLLFELLPLGRFFDSRIDEN